MAHPRRAKYIPYLKEKLGDVPVIFDQKNNVWDTCRRAWLAQDMSCEYGVVIQDDALVTRNFKKKAEKYLTGNYVYSFYMSKMLRGRAIIARNTGKNVIMSGVIFGEVALCMRTALIPDMIRFCDEAGAQTDQEITHWAKQRNIKICHTIPSLIDHRDEDSIYREINNLPPMAQARRAPSFHE